MAAFENGTKRINASIQIIETFVRLRKVSLSYADIAAKADEIENKLSGHDEQFRIFHETRLSLLEVPLLLIAVVEKV